MRKPSLSTIRSCLILILLLSLKAKLASAEQIAATNTAEKPAASVSHYDKNALHRLDLRIVGKSCPVCLLGIQKKVNALSGVVKAAVMLKKPYGVSIIYDAKQIQQAKILDAIKSYEKNTFVEGARDSAIARIPLVLIPPFANNPDAQDAKASEPSP
jgi:hypothetical protein